MQKMLENQGDDFSEEHCFFDSLRRTLDSLTAQDKQGTRDQPS